MWRAQWDFFIIIVIFLNVAATLPSFTANQMLETPAQMAIFDAFFCPRNGICPSNCHLLSLFLWFSFLFPAVPFQYRHSGALWRFFFSYISLSWREGGGIELPTSTFLNNLVLDYFKKESTGNSGFYQSCDPTAKEDIVLILPLL